MNVRLISIAERLMSIPAVPYYESAVSFEAERVCAEHRIGCRRDRFGNLWVGVENAPDRRPLLLVAHLDHPGFEILGVLGTGQFRARFQGGVPDQYFRKGIKVRLMPEGIPAVLGRALPGKREFELRTDKQVSSRPAFAVWELPDFRREGERIVGRACDDLIGAAAILTALIQLRRARVHVIGLLSRGEEVGFHGVLAAAEAGSIPKNALAISLETSRELPGSRMGDGVIIRVGDKSSIFDSAATRFLAETASGLQQRKGKFKYQRALMSGGTCEATALQEYGCQTAAVCVALGNYHNCGAANRIRAEFVDARDAESMVELLVETARQMPRFERLAGKLPRRLRKLAAEAKRNLLRRPL